jgi:NAD(P)-dependent dehydrogenase (short-subunit alcohol dehydrogenase family)
MPQASAYQTSLSGLNVLVSGGTTGIGRATAQETRSFSRLRAIRLRTASGVDPDIAPEMGLTTKELAILNRHASREF